MRLAISVPAFIFSASTFALLVLTSCGQEPLPSHMPSPSGRKAHAAAVQTWQVGEDLAAKKHVIVETVKRAGKDEATACLLLAVAMGESSSCSAKDRDCSKDSLGPARNFSAFNLNGDFLSSVGVQGGDAEKLNDDGNLALATRAVLAGLDKYGPDKFLSYHRGGATARDDLTSYGAAEYRQAIYAVRDFIMADKSLMGDARRAGLYIPHV